MINLLPYTQKKYIGRIRTLRVASAILGGVVVLILSVFLANIPTLTLVRSHQEALEAYTDALQSEGVMVPDETIVALQARVKVLREKVTAKVPPSPLSYITIVQSHKVSAVRLVGFDVGAPEKQTMQVRGVATNRESLQKFIALLQADTRIATVDSPITNFVKNAESEFVLTLTFKNL